MCFNFFALFLLFYCRHRVLPVLSRLEPHQDKEQALHHRDTRIEALINEWDVLLSHYKKIQPSSKGALDRKTATAVSPLALPKTVECALVNAAQQWTRKPL